jgi:hypothetical protein
MTLSFFIELSFAENEEASSLIFYDLSSNYIEA